MAGNNDILAIAAIDVSAFEQGTAKLTSRLDAIEKAGSNAASGIAKIEKSANLLKNIKIADIFNSSLQMLSGAGGQASKAMNTLGNSAMIARNNFDDAGGASVALNNSFGRLVDVASQIPGPIGTTAKAIGQVLSISAEAKDKQDEFNDAMAHGAWSTSGFCKNSHS